MYIPGQRTELVFWNNLFISAGLPRDRNILVNLRAEIDKILSMPVEDYDKHAQCVDYLNAVISNQSRRESLDFNDCCPCDTCDSLRMQAGKVIWKAQREAASRSTSKTARKGFVYLVRNNRNGYVKIGFSVSPKAREATLQSEEPDLEMIATWPGTMREEADLHLRYSHLRIRGEWFKLSPQDVSEIQEKATA